ncbi:MAG: hypothetical protein ACI8S6_001916 [Myxococcota bacterium]|jgi:hypothetical protein
MSSTMELLRSAPATLRASAKTAPPKQQSDLLRLAKLMEGSELLTSRQAAEILEVSSVNTIKNWLKGGHFPGASQTSGGHWRFLLSEVLSMKEALAELARQNARKGATAADLPDLDEEDVADFPVF